MKEASGSIKHTVAASRHGKQARSCSKQVVAESKGWQKASGSIRQADVAIKQ